MTRAQLIILAAAGSFALLAGAFAFQYIGGMAPCKLCLWQRWPHAAAILLGAVALATGPRLWIAFFGCIAALTTAGIGLYHSGVEQDWWEGPQDCTGFDISNLTPAELLDRINAAPLVRCDEIPWEMLGLSMASWNAVASLFFAALWALAMVRPAN